MALDPAQLSGAQRAAVLLMSLGENDAAQVLKHMSAKEVQQLGMAMATIANVSQPQVESVVDDFVGSLDGQTSLGIGTDAYIRNVMVQALGEDKASGLVERILHGRNSKGLDALKWMEPRAIAELVRGEHPQIVSIVLAHLESEQAADVLRQLPDAIRADVLLRIATLDGVPQQALEELDQIMQRRAVQGPAPAPASVGGAKVAAGILSHLGPAFEQQVIAAMREVDDALGTQIQDLMFVFDNLAGLEDRAIQALLREVPGDKLALALRGADPAAREKITKNMSQRAAQILMEDMEARGPVRLADVEAAQKDILGIARKLADEGTIALGASAGDYV